MVEIPLVGEAWLLIKAKTEGFAADLKAQTDPALAGLAKDAEGAGLAAGAGLGSGVHEGAKGIEKDLEGTGTRGGGKLASGLQSSLGGITTALGAVGVPVGALESKISSLGDTSKVSGAKGEGAFNSLANVGGASLLGIGVGVGVVGAASLKMAANFQTSMTQLVTGAGESESNIKMVSNGILAMSGQVGTSSTDLAKGMYLIESAGFHGASGLNVLKAAAEGAKVGNADLATVADAVTSAMGSYHLGAGQAVAVTNEMIATVAAGKMHMQDLAGALSAVLPTAAAAGVSFAEVGGAIATMTSKGTSAQQAAQNLSSTIQSLSGPNQQQIKEMEQLGLNATDVATHLGSRGLSGTMDMLVSTITQHMGPAGTVLLGTFKQSQSAASDAKTMLDALPASLQKTATAFMQGDITQKEWKATLKSLPVDQRQLAMEFAATENKSRGFNDALKSGGPAAQTFNAALSKVLGTQAGVSVALQTTGTSLGTYKANVDSVTKAHDAGGKSVTGFNLVQKDLSFQMEQAKATVQSMAIRLGDALIPMVEKALKGFSAFASFLEANKPLLIAFAAVIGTVLVAAIGAFIAKMVVAGVESLVSFGKMISAGATWIVETSAQLATWVAETAASVAETGALWAMYAAEWISTQVGAMATFIAEHAIMAASFIAENTVMIASAMAAFVAENLATLGIIAGIALVVGAIIYLATHWSQVWGEVKRIAEDVWKFLTHVWGEIWGDITKIWGDIEGFFKKFWPMILVVMTGGVLLIPMLLIKYWTQITNDIHKAWSAIINFFTGIPGQILGALSSFGGMLLGWINDAISTVTDWIHSAWDAEVQFWSQLPGRVIGVISGFGGMIYGWITSAINTVTSWVHGVWDAEVAFWTGLPGRIIAAVSGFLSMFVGWITAAWNAFSSAVTTAWDSTVSFFSSIPGKILSALGNAGSVLLGWGRDLVGGIVSGVEAAAGAIGSALMGVITGGINSAKSALNSIPVVGAAFSAIGLATGGYVTQPTLALVGEAGPEFVIPEALLKSNYSAGVKPLNATMSPGAAMTAPSGYSPTGPTSSAPQVHITLASGAVQITGLNPNSSQAASTAVSDGLLILAEKLGAGQAPTRVGAAR